MGRRIVVTMLLLMIGSMISAIAYAQEESKITAEKTVHLYPDIITNLKSDKKQSYILLRLSVKVNGEQAEQIIKDNEPLIRDQVIYLLNGLTKAEVRRDKEYKSLRKNMLQLVQKTLENENNIVNNGDASDDAISPNANSIYLKKIVIE